MSIQRSRVVWSNFPGAPGYSNFYWNEAVPSAEVASLKSFFEAIKTLIAGGAVLTYPSSVDVIDETTGNITSSTPITQQTPTTATGSGAFSGASGAVVHWITDGFVGGRRVRGRTFLVPLTGGSFDTNGSILTSALTTLQTAASALVTATTPAMSVWRRPTAFTAGSVHTVSSAVVPDLAAVLRSRRT